MTIPGSITRNITVKWFVRVHQKGKMPTEKIEMHQLRCVWL